MSPYFDPGSHEAFSFSFLVVCVPNQWYIKAGVLSQFFQSSPQNNLKQQYQSNLPSYLSSYQRNQVSFIPILPSQLPSGISARRPISTYLISSIYPSKIQAIPIQPTTQNERIRILQISLQELLRLRLCELGLGQSIGLR